MRDERGKRKNARMEEEESGKKKNDGRVKTGRTNREDLKEREKVRKKDKTEESREKGELRTKKCGGMAKKMKMEARRRE